MAITMVEHQADLVRLQHEAEGQDLKVDIDFEKSGPKRLMAKFAGLEIL